MANHDKIHDKTMAILQDRLFSVKVSQHDEQPGSQSRAQAQASNKSPMDGTTTREYFMKAMREEASNGMNRPMRTNTPSAGPAYEPNPNPSLDSTPSLGPSSAVSASNARLRFERGRSMPLYFETFGGIHNNTPSSQSSAHPPLQADAFGYYGISEDPDALNNITFSSTGTTGGTGGAATNLPLPISLQTPGQASVWNWLGLENPSLPTSSRGQAKVTKTPSHIHHMPSRSKELHVRREQKNTRTTFAELQRPKAKAARRAQAAAPAQENMEKRRMSSTRAWTMEQQRRFDQKTLRAYRMAERRKARDPRYGMGFAAAATAGSVPLGMAGGQNVHGSHSQEELPGNTSSLDGNVSGSDQMEVEQEKLLGDTSSLDGNVSGSEQMEVEQERSESVQGNVSQDEEMEGQYRPESLQVNFSGYGQMEMMVPQKTESLEGNVSDDDHMEE